MARFPSWIEGIGADAPVCDAAEHSLRTRIEAVEHYLRKAARRSHDDEHIHRLRVWTRRSLAVLDLYTDQLPKKDRRWFARTLRKVRHAAGRARDLDVLVQNYASETGTGAEEFLSHILKRREKAQKPIVRIHRKLTRDDRLRNRFEKLLESVCKNTDSPAFGPWADAQLRRSLRRFFKASRTDPSDLAGLHQFRIRAKELRYAMELLAPAYPEEFRTELYPMVEELQESLGEIHDHAVAVARFRRWAAKAKSERETLHVRELIAREHKVLRERLRDFAARWTPDFQREFHDAFAQLLEDKSAHDGTAGSQS